MFVPFGLPMAKWRSCLRTMAAATLHIAAAVCLVPDARAQSVRDSAGTRVATSTKPSWTAQQQMRLAAVPDLVVGDREDEPYLLNRVRGAFKLADGRIVVANGESNELRFFDAKGTHVKTTGHTGDGPGEFRSIQRLHHLSGDTIAVLHDRSSVSLFTPTGAFIKRMTYTTGGPSLRPEGVLKAVTLPLDGGVRLVVSMPMRPDAGLLGTRSDAKALHELVDARDGVLRNMGTLPFMQMISEAQGAGKPWLGAEEIFVGRGKEFCLGYGTSYEIRCYSGRGELQQIVRRAWAPVKITQQDIDTFAEEWLKRWSKKTGPELERERSDLRDDNYATTLPAFSALLADNAGRLWARAPKAIDGAVAGSLNDYSIGASTWSVFGADGLWLGDVTMPPRFSPTDIGTDYVLGILRDDDGVQTVVRYRLAPR